MAKVVLQLLKQYKYNAPLINSMVKPADDQLETVVCYLSGEPDGLNQMEERAHKVIYCGIKKRNVSWTKLKTCRKIAEVIDQVGADLVVCQFRRQIPIGIVASVLSQRKPKTIGVLHGIVGGSNSFFRKLLHFIFYRELTKIVAVSRSGAEEIKKHNFKIDDAKLEIIENGVDSEPFLNQKNAEAVIRSELYADADDAHFVFLMVGRLAPVKNHVRTLRAFQMLAEHHSSVRLLIAGEGSVKLQLETLIDELGLKEKVFLLGQRKDIPRLMKSVDAFLMPSVRESFGMALAEAMLSCIPVVTSRNTGTAELVPDEQHGYLVDPDSVRSILAAMEDVLNSSEEERLRRAKKGQDRVMNNFTSEKMAEKYEALFRSVLYS